MHRSDRARSHARDRQLSEEKVHEAFPRSAGVARIITHLAFYSGWANAVSAVAVAKDVFAVHNGGANQLAAASGPPPPLDEAAQADPGDAS
jgi:4-carboxymuconolactone decarboxylase